MASPGNVPVSVSAESIQMQLEKILASSGFVHSERLRRFLRFSVEQALQGRPEKLKEYAIALEVFDKDESYDSNTDPIVRVEARRLRTRLQEYYAAAGQNDPILIEIPKGSYVATFQTRDGAAAPAPRQRSPWLRRNFIMGAVAAAVLLFAAVWWWRTRPGPPPSGLILTRLTSDSGLTTDPTLSPDGTLVAYASDRGGRDLDIWVQQVSGGEPLRLTQHEADDHQPAFSPDGTKIAFRSERRGGGIYIVPSLGGEARLIAQHGWDPRFSPDGNSVAYWVGSIGGDLLPPAGKVYVAPASGGSPRQLQPDFASAVCPVWSPDGKHLLFKGARDPGGPMDWWVAVLDDGQAIKTGATEEFQRHGLVFLSTACAVGWVNDAIIFAAKLGDSTNLWRASVSPTSWRVMGPLQRLTFGTAQEVHPSMARNGDVVFSSLSENVDVWSLRMEANQALVTSEMERLTESAGRDIFPSVAADGRRMAFISDRTGYANVWLKDLETGKETPVTVTPSAKRYPKISPDGSKVAYTEYVNGKPILFSIPVEGGTAEKICEDGARVWHWTTDGKQILYQPSEPNGTRRVAVRNLSSDQKFDLLRHPNYDLAEAHLSPDDAWVVFHTIAGPVRRQLFIAPFHAGRLTTEKEWIVVRDAESMDRNAAWSPDGHILYFLSEWDGFRCVWARRFTAGTTHGTMIPLYHFHNARRSLASLGDVGAIGLSVAPHKLIFSLGEITGNIWLARPERRP